MEPVSGETIVLPEEQASEARAETVIKTSRENYAIEWAKANPKTKRKADDTKLADDENNDGPGFSPQAEALES